MNLTPFSTKPHAARSSSMSSCSTTASACTRRLAIGRPCRRSGNINRSGLYPDYLPVECGAVQPDPFPFDPFPFCQRDLRKNHFSTRSPKTKQATSKEIAAVAYLYPPSGKKVGFITPTANALSAQINQRTPLAKAAVVITGSDSSQVAAVEVSKPVSDFVEHSRLPDLLV